MSDKKDIVLTIGDQELTQDECSWIAFKVLLDLNRNYEAAVMYWRSLTGDYNFSSRDYAFLVLYFIEHLLDPADKPQLGTMIMRLQKEIRD
jgi:hypothetical protein